MGQPCVFLCFCVLLSWVDGVVCSCAFCHGLMALCVFVFLSGVVFLSCVDVFVCVFVMKLLVLSV